MSEQSETTSAPPAESDAADRQKKQVVVRYGRMGDLGVFRHDLETPPAPGTMLVVRTERGAELGRVLINIDADEACASCHGCLGSEALEAYLQANGEDYPFSRRGRVLRVANAQDLNDQQHLDRSAGEVAAFCRQQIKQVGLGMKLIEVEHLLGGERIVFFFTAEHRVDFRELVRHLAGRYHTRIEMRQLGARDEARLIADYERCGRRCCCQEYLKFLKPVSMKMAKMQKATLDPTKISGRCGRLMCCLRYEDSTYDELRKLLPRKGTWVRTADGTVGRVIEGQTLTQLVRVALADGAPAVFAVEDIVERDVAEPPPSPVKPPRERPRAAPERRRRTPAERPAKLAVSDYEMPEPAPDEAGAPEPAGAGAASEKAAGEKASGRTSRRRRRKKKKGAGERGVQPQAKRRHPEALSVPPHPGQSSDGAGPQPAGGAAAQKPPAQGASAKKKRRRRKRRPRGQRGAQGGGSQGGGASQE